MIIHGSIGWRRGSYVRMRARKAEKKTKNSDGFGGMKLERFGADCVKCSRALEGKKKCAK